MQREKEMGPRERRFPRLGGGSDSASLPCRRSSRRIESWSGEESRRPENYYSTPCEPATVSTCAPNFGRLPEWSARRSTAGGGCLGRGVLSSPAPLTIRWPGHPCASFLLRTPSGKSLRGDSSSE